MASHAPQSLFFITNEGSVMADGYSTRLAKGQFGIVDKGAAPSSLGMAVTSTITTPATDRNRLFELRLGIAPLTPTRSQSDKAYSTVPFKISEIVDIKVNAPKTGISVDELIIGYDGINANSAIVLGNGDNEVIDITLAGEAIGMLGYQEAKVTVKLYLEAPNTGTFTMHEIVEEGVKRLKNITLLGGVSILNYIDITPVNSSNTNTVTGTDFTFFKLKVNDKGNYTALGLVQAQFPNFLVKRESFAPGAAEAGVSTYVILAPEATVLDDYSLVVATLSDPNCDGIPTITTNETLISWTEGATCTAISKAFTLQLADDKCGQDKLDTLQDFYPELMIAIATSPAAAACQTVYETEVLSEIVCEECSPLLRDLFVAEAPVSFEGISWVEEPKVYSGTALMGIHIKGKVNILAGGEEYRDDLPFVYSSTRLSVANEAPGTVSESYNSGTNGRFKVKMLSIAADPEALGAHFYDLEERTRVYFENRQRLAGNNYGKAILGQESHLKPLSQYVDYVVRVRTNRFAQSFSGEVVENFDYHILAEIGKHAAIQTQVNLLAVAAGLPTVSAGF